MAKSLGLIVVLASLMLTASAHAQQSSSLAGDWSGEGIELSLVKIEDGYAGSLGFRGNKYSVQLNAEGSGSFSDGQSQFPLTLKQTAGGLALQSGNAIFQLKPVGAAKANPLDAPQEKPKPGGAAPDGAGADDAAAPAPQDWTTYRHPTGAYIEHPRDWRTQETQIGLAFIPPDFDQNSELILATGAAADQIKSPTDPMVGQYFDATMASISPNMRRVGTHKEVACRGGKGALYEYSGTLATGQAAKARIYTTILGQQAVAITIIATEAKMQHRAAVVDRMFGTLGQGEAKRDPALVGTWKSMQSDTDLSTTGNVFSQTDSVFTLAADGTILCRTRAYTSVTAKDGDGVDVGGATSESEKTYQGTWSAADGRLFVSWQGGTSNSGTYQVHSNGMTFTPDGGKPVSLARE